MKHVIITGATGFVGTWLVKEMLSRGIETTVIVRDKSKLSKDVYDRVEIIETDDYDKVPGRENGSDAFYHLAWSGVASTEKNNQVLQLTNIELSIKALKLAQRMGSATFIASGTVAEYTLCDNVMNYSMRQTPSDFYGAAKVAVYYILEVMAKQIHMPFIWALLPSTFGEGRNDNNIIIYTIRELLARRKPKYGELDQMWDFLYISEVTKALWLIGEKGTPGKIYGIGSGQYLRLKDYIMKVRDIINPELELGINELPPSTGKVISSCVGTYDLAKDTGFQVMVGFEEGIKKTIEYYRSKFN